MPLLNVSQLEWLTSRDGQHQLDWFGSAKDSPAAVIRQFARRIGRERADLVQEQTELRRRAVRKFSNANHMFFTRRLLEQATEERIAAYKASRFPLGATVADLCCGLGGDLLGLAMRCRLTVAVDRDPLAIGVARANCRSAGIASAHFVLADAATIALSACDAWHIDPDRRTPETRTSRPELGSPDTQVLQRLLDQRPAAAIKLAPAAAVAKQWRQEAQLEWIGTRRECRQQVAWFGPLARSPGRRTATVIGEKGDAWSLTAEETADSPVTDRIESFVYEPHAAVIAANLCARFAQDHNLAAIAPDLAYLTGPNLAPTPLASAFQVIEVMGLDRRRLKKALRLRRIGRLEIKVRGAPIDPVALTRQLSVPGEEEGTVLVAGTRTGVRAILARRVSV